MAGDKDMGLAIKTYGHRLFEGQTVPEYLLEFALVFLGDRPSDSSPELGGPGNFPTRPVERGELGYQAHARVGLKRFIFFERSKQEKRLEVDRLAYEEMRSLVEDHIESDVRSLTAADVVDIIQELFYGYNAVRLNRSWFAQSLLPISRELMFPEAMRNNVRITQLTATNNGKIDIRGKAEVDNAFDFHSYLFLARGGEVYYLHVLSGLLNSPDELREEIENGLNELFNSRRELSRLANWLQETWEKHMGIRPGPVTKTCQWIPQEYEQRAPYTCRELAAFLRARMDPLQKIQLLSTGVVLQILRMMHDRAGAAVKRTKTRPAWVIHVPGCKSNDVKTLATQSYQQCEDDLLGALYTQADKNATQDQVRQLVAASSRNAHLLFRKLGKATDLVVPPQGSHTRFSLSEDLLKFLVMALIEPGDKILLSEFLRRLYEHFGMVIGPAELVVYQESNDEHMVAQVDSSLLRENEEALKDMLKACGFLRDLSDATAIVENPFGG